MKNYPLITIVTPVYNAARFLEQTIQSVLNQNYPNLEYIIVDGGSTDGSMDIIKKYQQHLAWWTSEPDNGMYDAINKGFQRSNGEIMAWSPANDLYVKDAFQIVAEILNLFANINWLTSLYKLKIDEYGRETQCYKVPGFNKQAFCKGYNLLGKIPYARYCIPQQSTFWRRSLWKRAGAYVNSKYKAGGDFELWTRFYRHAELCSVDHPLGVFREHDDQISQAEQANYEAECYKAFINAGGTIMSKWETIFRERFVRRLVAHFKSVQGLYFKNPVVIRDNDTGEWVLGKQLMM
jgi:glycosyltransferase involved in cell wall biosynthesis